MGSWLRELEGDGARNPRQIAMRGLRSDQPTSPIKQSVKELLVSKKDAFTIQEVFHETIALKSVRKIFGGLEDDLAVNTRMTFYGKAVCYPLSVGGYRSGRWTDIRRHGALTELTIHAKYK